MFQNQVLTIYNFFINPNKTIDVYRSVSINGFVDETRRSNYLKDGKRKAHSAYISVNDIDSYLPNHLWQQLNDKSTKFTVQDNGLDFIVIGDCSITIDTTDLASMQTGIDLINQSYKSYKVQEFDEKFHGSRRMWHIEVGGL